MKDADIIAAAPYWVRECGYCQCDRHGRCIARDADGRSCRQAGYVDPDQRGLLRRAKEAHHAERVAYIEHTLASIGLEPLAQPERKRLACWLKAAELDEEVYCPEDGTFYGRMPTHVSRALGNLEAKRNRQAAYTDIQTATPEGQQI